MYSPQIVEYNLAALYDQQNISVIRYDDGMVDDMTNHLVGLVKTYGKDGQPTEFVRDLTQPEWDYINNERILCKYDFRYAANRYFNIQIIDNEGSPVVVDRFGKYGFMNTQEALLRQVEKDEVELYKRYKSGNTVLGLLYFIHKARQTGFTAQVRMMEKHRTFFWPDTMSLAASSNEDMVHEIYTRDKVMYERLPWFLKPKVQYDTKDQQLGFEGINTITLYHQGNQKGGMGTGRSISVAHLTECALWDQGAAHEYANTQRILTDLFPAIPKTINTLYCMESTAMGIGGFWYDQVELIRSGKSRFKLFFCPWYAADKKYADTPDSDWTPSDYVLHVADVVEETSPDYLGYRVTLTKEQMFWYDRQMDEHTGRLFTFFSNYPTTIEESFQNSGDCAFQWETLAALHKGIGPLHGVYDLNAA